MAFQENEVHANKNITTSIKTIENQREYCQTSSYGPYSHFANEAKDASYQFLLQMLDFAFLLMLMFY